MRATIRRSADSSGSLAGLLILALTLLAFGVRMYRLDFQSLWRDEMDTLRFATQTLPELTAMFRQVGQNGPLYFLMLRPWLAVAGHSEFALRFLSACFGTLSVPLAYRLLARLAGAAPALLLALLMSCAPFLVWYGQEAKMYALLTLLVPLELFLLVLAVQTRRLRYWLLLYLGTALSVYTHLLAALAIPVQLAWIILAPFPEEQPEPRGLARRTLLAAGYLAALVVPYLPVLWWALPLWSSWSYRTGFPFVQLDQILRTLVAVFARGPLGDLGIPVLPMVFAVVCGSLLWGQARGGQAWRVVGMLLAWLLLPPLSLYLLSLSVPLFTERYLIWAMPAFLALAALGVSALITLWRPLALAVAAAVLALNLADTAAYQHTPIKSDFRSAAHYVLAHRQPGDRLIFQIPYGQYTFAYYAGPLGDYGDGPYTNNAASTLDVERWMAAQTDGAPAVWLVASEVPLWDERGLTEAWLAARGRVTDQARFTLVSVTRYALP